MSEGGQKRFSIGTLELPEKECITFNAPPLRIMTNDDVVSIFREALAQGANDIHINTGHPVIIESDNKMYRITRKPIDQTEFEKIADVLRDKSAATTLLGQGSDYDGYFVLTDHFKNRRRLRVNMTALTSVRHNKVAGLVLRPMEERPPKPSDIGLSDELVSKMFPQKGAVYVIGPTGSGKTTTFASIIGHAAENGGAYHGHLACYESPPEFDLESMSSKHLLVTQCAIHQPWGLPSFADGIRNALRRHPSAVMIGEVRDLETVKAVVEAALTGHPVFGTVHADNPASAFQRLLSRFPAGEKEAGLYDLIETTEVILAQRLINRIDGKRVAIREWIVFNNEMRGELLSIGQNTGELINRIREMVKEFGCTFGSSAKKLYDEGVIDLETLSKVFDR